MTPQEKAGELIRKFKNFKYPSELGSEFVEIHKNPVRAAAHCAIICVDEILTQPYAVGKNIDESYEIVKYWKEVKEELLRL